MELLRGLIAVTIMILLQPLFLLFIGFTMGSIVGLIMPTATASLMTGLGLGALTFAQLSAIVAFLSGFFKMGFNVRDE